MLDSLKARVNQRSYQRGVHLGERIDPGDYLWPEGVTPLDGIMRQATTGERYRPALEYFMPQPTIDGALAPRGATSILTIDEHRAAQLSMLRPKFGFPVKRNPVQA